VLGMETLPFSKCEVVCSTGKFAVTSAWFGVLFGEN